MSYPNGLLKNRSVIRQGKYAVISPEGRVINVIPGFGKGFEMTILCSKKLGSKANEYIGTVHSGAKTTKTFGGNGLETCLYVVDGEGKLTVTVGDKEVVLSEGGYVYAPASLGMDIRNDSEKEVRIFVHKRRFISLEGYEEPKMYSGNVNDMEEVNYAEMENVHIKDLLPTDMGMDMNMHILIFEPGGCHPFIETHVQEHGAYLLSGEGLYLLGDEWIEVQKEDYIWFGPFSQQACYGIGRERLAYIYSKDCNRDEEL